MKNTLIALWAAIIPIISLAQVASTASILSSAQSEEAVRLAERMTSFLQNTSHEMPRIQELEFRTETDEFQVGQQEYLFRLSPNTTKMRRAQRGLHQQHIVLTQQEQLLLINDALEDRYEALVEWKQLQEKEEILEALEVLYADRVNVLTKSATWPDFDPEDLIDAEAEAQEIAFERLTVSGKMQQLAVEFGQFGGNTESVTPDTAQWISLARIAGLLQTSGDSISNHPLLMRREANIGMVQQEYALERAATSRWLDFVQARYGGNDNVLFKEVFSVGVGFKLPLKGDKKLDLNELELEQIEEENRYQLLQSQLLQQAEAWKGQLLQLLQQHQLLQTQIANSQSTPILERYRQLDDANPLTLLKMREVQLKKALQLQDVRYRIYRAYIQWLDVSGRMIALPLKNYLSEGLERL